MSIGIERKWLYRLLGLGTGLLILVASPVTGQDHLSQLHESKYFTFHSDYWFNLHHFLHEQSAGKQSKYLQRAGEDLIEIGHDSVMQSLPRPDRKILDNALEYYRKHLRLSALSDDRFLALRTLSPDQPVPEDLQAPVFARAINQVSPVYRKYFWPLHHAHNQAVLKEHIQAIRTLEEHMIGQLEQYAGSEWPRGKVRVDLTAYGGYYGSYSWLDPLVVAVISTLDPFIRNLGFIELVFLQGTTILFSDDSDLAWMAFDVKQEVASGAAMSDAGGFVGGIHLYLNGRLVQDALKDLGVEYTMLLDRWRHLDWMNTPEFVNTVERYYQKRAGLRVTLERLMR
ncbi:MAG: hypothetical protein R3301_15875 [Saprospiraceae bacterium]|nr:hypothetical protein [Saprospiraceae bacterium]